VLDDHLTKALLGRLREDWSAHNAALFGGLMRPPVLGLSAGTDTWAHWRADRRGMELAWRLVLDQPWLVVQEVLKHEMAHQFCDEVLGITGEGPHGPGFRRVCAQRGIDPAHAGLPAEDAGAAAPEVRILRKVRRLLALAESPEPHEAQAATAAAQRLLLEHNLELARAQAPRRFGVRQLGPIRQRHPVHRKVLAGILAAHFFVEAMWVHGWRVETGQPGRVLEICGTPENLDVAAYVWDVLLRTAESLWRSHRAAAGLSSDRHRRRFLSGVMVGYLEKLDAEAARHAGTGLVWSGDPLLQDWLARRHPASTWRTARAAELVADHSWSQGRAQGRELTLHKGVAEHTHGATGPVRSLPGPTPSSSPESS
jgi:hypothetical protein